MPIDLQTFLGSLVGRNQGQGSTNPFGRLGGPYRGPGLEDLFNLANTPFPSMALTDLSSLLEEMNTRQDALTTQLGSMRQQPTMGINPAQPLGGAGQIGRIGQRRSIASPGGTRVGNNLDILFGRRPTAMEGVVSGGAR